MHRRVWFSTEPTCARRNELVELDNTASKSKSQSTKWDPLIHLFLEHYLLPPPISSWRGPINASRTALARDVLASFCLWELDGIAVYLDCLFSQLLNIHINTSEVFFCPLPWMKDSRSHLVLMFLPRKNSFVLARMLLFITWLMEKHKCLWNVDNDLLHSKENFLLSEISTVLHARKQQLQAKQGRSKSKQCYPLHLIWNKEKMLFLGPGDFWFRSFVMFSNPSFHYSLVCFTESFSLLLPLSFLSPVPVCFPFMSLQFMYLQSFWRDFSVHLPSQSLPFSHQTSHDPYSHLSSMCLVLLISPIFGFLPVHTPHVSSPCPSPACHHIPTLTVTTHLILLLLLTSPLSSMSCLKRVQPIR